MTDSVRPGGEMDDSNSPAIARFIQVAREYTAWVDGVSALTPPDLLTLHWMLARLQVALVELPAVTSEGQSAELERSHSAHHDRFVSLTSRFQRAGLNRYHTMLFPLDDDREPVEGSLADDIADIYRDLESGLAHAHDGKHHAAVWEWRFGYFSHWGYHLADAQAALRQYLDQFAAAWLDPPR